MPPQNLSNILVVQYIPLYLFSPDDPRVLEALGSCYIELNKNSEAKKVSFIFHYCQCEVVLLFQCLVRAIANKEMIGTAIIKLAK